VARIGATVAVTVLLVGAAPAQAPRDLIKAFMCIYRHERGQDGWRTNTGNGYFGGLQMDLPFIRTWGFEFYRLWGTADRWPREVQLAVAIRAYVHRGWSPWPVTSRICGLRS
jgi:hypothetical protein